MVPTGTKLCDEWVVERHNRTELLVEVYQVRSPRLGRTVARVLGVGGAQAEGFVKALGALRGVEHKALAPVVAVGKEPCGVVVISGTPEAATLRELWQRGGRMKASEVGRMVTEVSLALETLHANAPVVVHRALSPEVIALAVQPARVWLDAWWLAHCVVEAGILPAEFPLAAPEYRAPDDLLGRVHPRSDIFALASVAFEALTGSLAYEPGSSEAKILRGERPLVSALRPEMPPELDAVLARAWSQEQPFPNPIAFARELSRVVGSATGSQPGFLSPLAARSRAVHMDLTRPVVALPRPEAITPERNGSLHSNPTRQLQVPPRVEALRSDEVPGEDDVDKAFDAMLNSTERRDSQGSPPPSQPAPEPTPGEEWAASVPGTRASRPPASSTPPSPLRSIRPTLVSGVPPRPSGVKTAPPPLPAGITTARHKAVVPPPPPPQAPPEVELVDADEDEDRTEAGVFPSEALRQALEAAEQATRETPTSGLGATQKVLVPKLRPPPVAPQGGARTADQSDRWSSMERPVLPSVAPPAPPPMASARPAAPPQSAQPPEEVAQDRWEASPTAPHGTAVATPVPVPMPSPAAPVAAPAWTSPEPLREPPIVANRRTPEPAPGERTTPAGRPTAPDGTNAPPVVAPRPSQPPLPAVPVMAPRPPGPPVAVTPPSLPPEDPLAVRVARILGTSIVLGSLVVT
ncbi:MAG: hypothetical protein HY909_07890 [Deltaproteobacteria bacterium]|nr:hypothetical protein [Deltaproteobacteria bacterium]